MNPRKYDTHENATGDVGRVMDELESLDVVEGVALGEYDPITDKSGNPRWMNVTYHVTIRPPEPDE